ncbi:MAG: hypothetical protein VKL59_25925 [Nostocaceae cyanobacterium]|nr:hypothetical protein [Nostocaceae cyanobacterium]
MQTEPRNRDISTSKIHLVAAPWQKAVGSLSLVLLGAAAAFAGGYFADHNHLVSQRPSNLVATPVNAATPVTDDTDTKNFITEVVKKVGPAVVRIDASRTVTTELPNAFNDPFFRQFFGSQMPIPQEKHVEKGTGSGFIISADGKALNLAVQPVAFPQQN